jgi:hypothetical protein
VYVHVLVLPVWSGIFVQNESQSGDVACSSLLLEGVCLYVGPTVCTAAAGGTSSLSRLSGCLTYGTRYGVGVLAHLTLVVGDMVGFVTSY